MKAACWAVLRVVADQAAELESSAARAASLGATKEALERQLDATEQASRALALEHEHAIACEREGTSSAEERVGEANEALRESQAVAREASDARARAETRLHEFEQTNADLARQLDDAASEAASLSTKLEASVVAQAAAVAEADRLRSEIEDHQQEVVASNESLCVEREASSTLHDQLSIAVQLRDETQQGAMALEARCKRLEESVRVGEDTVSQTMSRVLKLESERDSRTQVILDMETQLSKVTRKALSYEARSRRLEADITSRERQLQNADAISKLNIALSEDRTKLEDALASERDHRATAEQLLSRRRT